MNELPKCKLCGSEPSKINETWHHPYHCPNDECQLNEMYLTQAQWIFLMSPDPMLEKIWHSLSNVVEGAFYNSVYWTRYFNDVQMNEIKTILSEYEQSKVKQ